jgi:hypothetical protein
MSWLIFLQSIRDSYPLMYAEYTKSKSFDAIAPSTTTKKRGKKS